MWKALIIVASLTVSTAEGQEMRAGDVLPGRSALETRLLGRDIVFYDNGRAVFREDGRYAWEYGEGGGALGWFEIGDDSRICVRFDNGFERCDLIVVDGERFVLITEKGERFPIRPE